MAPRAHRSGPVAERLRRFLRNEQVILSALAALIGTISAYGAIGFRQLIGTVQLGAFGTASERLVSFVEALPWWQVVLAPALGGLVVGLFIHFLQTARRPHGVADVIAASALHAGRMPLKDGLVAAAASVLSIGAGASVGREGPVVHLGASLASWLAQRLRLRRSLSLTLLGCGVAAAVAASFNAPIAGAFFALEMVIGHYALSAFAPVVIAAVVGTIVARVHLGDFPAFIVVEHEIVSFLEVPAFIVLGLLSAAVAIAFIKGVLLTQAGWERTPVPRWLRPMIGGLAVGAIALVLPEVLGVGYEATDRALQETLPLWLLLALVAAKLAATSISLGSGFAGGVFSPSLFVGAMAGGAFGLIVAALLPTVSSQGVYAIAGMGAVAGAVLGAPISTILMVFELTGDYAVTIVVMVTVAVAAVVTRQLVGVSFFHSQLAARGLSVEEGRETGLLRESRVGEVMSRRFHAIGRHTNIAAIKELLSNEPDADIVVIDEQHRLVGLVAFADIKDVAFEPGLDPLINAADVAQKSPVSLRVDDDLTTALRLMDAGDVARLPVVADDGSERPIGVVHHAAVVLAHNKALLAARREERGR